MDRWQGRVAIVTGGSAGIGASVCRQLSERGMKVVAVSPDLSGLEVVASEAKSAGVTGEIHPLQGDVVVEADVLRIVKWVRENLGGVDVLVNCAGVLHLSPLLSGTTAQWRHQLEVNVLGLCTITREVIKDMRDRDVNDGHVIHINSVLGHHHYYFNGLNLYCATKHAVTVLAEGLRRELRDINSHIRITSVSPGMAKTNIMKASGYSDAENDEFFRLNPHLEAKEIADAVEYALAAPPSVDVEEITLRATCASD